MTDLFILVGILLGFGILIAAGLWLDRGRKPSPADRPQEDDPGARAV